MNQNSVLTENMERKSANDNFERPAETSVATSMGHYGFIQEVSNLVRSVDKLTSQNFEFLRGELLKIATVSGNDIGIG